MSDTIKSIAIATDSLGNYEIKAIGADAINVEVSYDEDGNIITDTTTVVASKKNISEVIKNINGSNDMELGSHADATTKYGVGTSNLYGHVKIADNLDNVATDEALSTLGAETLKNNITTQIENINTQLTKNDDSISELNTKIDNKMYTAKDIFYYNGDGDTDILWGGATDVGNALDNAKSLITDSLIQVIRFETTVDTTTTKGCWYIDISSPEGYFPIAWSAPIAISTNGGEFITSMYDARSGSGDIFNDKIVNCYNNGHSTFPDFTLSGYYRYNSLTGGSAQDRVVIYVTFISSKIIIYDGYV